MNSLLSGDARNCRIAENLDVFGFQLDPPDLAAIANLDSLTGRIGPDPTMANF